MHDFELIVFDLDGTLVDSQADIIAAMEEAFAAHGLPRPSDDAVRGVVGLSLDHAIRELMPAGAHPRRTTAVMDTYKNAYTARKARRGDSERLFDGVHDALAHLDTPYVCLGVATGKSAQGLRATLARHALAERFVTLQSADDAPGKPHPRMLELAIADVGADAARTALIGDTTFDMAMARDAGAVPIGVTWGYHTTPDLVDSGAARLVGAFAELPGVLARVRPCAA